MAYVPPHRRNAFSLPFSTLYCINIGERKDRWRSIQMQAQTLKITVNRWEASVPPKDLAVDEAIVKLEWDTTKNAQYSRRVDPGTKSLSRGEIGCAMSHVALWRELSENESLSSMLILEDDAYFHKNFIASFKALWNVVPEDWDLLYLGFSDRGERATVIENKDIHVFVPEYGFHTHAYCITQNGSRQLLDSLPVQGPLDVWLADNEWFGLKVYCAVIPNEGWKRDDGTFEGSSLISQDRRVASDIQQSSTGRYSSRKQRS